MWQKGPRLLPSLMAQFSKTGVREVTKDPSLRQSRQQINVKFGYASTSEKGIKFTAKPTTEVVDMQYRNGYRPTVRVNHSLKCAVKEQTGYKRMYILTPLQVLLAQAFLSGLAEVRIVWNLMGLVH